MKTTVVIKAPAEFNSLTPAQRLINMGFERSETKDKKGKKVIVYSKDGVDYEFRGAQPTNSEGSIIELIHIID